MAVAWFTYLGPEPIGYARNSIRKQNTIMASNTAMKSITTAACLAVAGLDFYNHNLDTSPEFYGTIITTLLAAPRRWDVVVAKVRRPVFSAAQRRVAGQRAGSFEIPAPRVLARPLDSEHPPPAPDQPDLLLLGDEPVALRPATA